MKIVIVNIERLFSVRDYLD